MIKKTLPLLIAGIALFGCNNDKQQEKTLLNEVIKIHDKVMTDDEAIMKNKAQLDKLAAQTPDMSVKDSVAHYTKLLNDADDIMMGWMNKFNPDSGKTHTEIMDYLSKQKAQILKVDSQLSAVTLASGKYLKSKGK